jgi:hypothetical protein
MSEIDKQLGKLDPAVRTRVEEALKRTLEAELSRVAGGDGGGGGGDTPNPFSRSKGWVFSRSKTSDVLRDPPEIIQNLHLMDEATFQQFAKRLVALKQLKEEKN